MQMQESDNRFNTNRLELIANAIEIVDAIREPLLVLEPDLTVLYANPAFFRYFSLKPADTEAKSIFEISGGLWDIPQLRSLLIDILPEKSTIEDYEVEHEFTELGPQTIVVNAREIERSDGKGRLILVAIEDITLRKVAERAISGSRQEAWRQLEEVLNRTRY